MNASLPVTVIGGYLGSGKTTLVNHLLRNANGLRLAVLVNEFGELPIDEDLIIAEDDDIISIAGGCVCCSFGSDLTAALMKMAEMSPRPDHLLIESSGVAIPSAIAASISLLNDFTAEGVVVVADAETLRRSATNKYMGDTVLRQIGDADIMLLNKVDLVDAPQLSSTKEWVSKQNSNLSIVQTIQGDAPIEIVLGGRPPRSHAAGPHHDANNLDMLTLRPNGPVDAATLAAALTQEGLGVIRAKGFVTAPSGGKNLIQIVGRRWNVTPADDNHEDGVVCLGFKGELDQTRITSLTPQL